jgi:hypothetical protein
MGVRFCFSVGLSWTGPASVQFLFLGWRARAQPSFTPGQILNQAPSDSTGQPGMRANQPREQGLGGLGEVVSMDLLASL